MPPKLVRTLGLITLLVNTLTVLGAIGLGAIVGFVLINFI